MNSNTALSNHTISGHRGARGLAPENTLVGIQLAAHHGATWVEMDVQLTADLVPVMQHDRTINRCTNGRGSLHKKTLSALQAFDASQGYKGDNAAEFADQIVPTLEQALNACLKHNLSMNLEIKVHRKADERPLVEQVVKTVKAMNFPLDKLVFSSFSLGVLTYCKTLFPEVRRGLITSRHIRNMMEKATQLELFSIHYDQSKLTQSTAQKIKAAGLELHIWTLNDPEQAAMFRGWGVDNIITDYPDLFQGK
ncbi:hypothetical protein A3K86_04315 [Photobacterium jeanii]|uniref:GP-PDE domain-containing protein n=1 Tax=Photobacterium jeanii TaxID=858640 RepID=A0A178KNJ9_9GAMM|nr:glycerophosphodiester phosphodiesterase family protein [Photobacterium jeanii]OAN18132.1 hypothetical protein A3K86_04315 [Photobacterium jeanii]PST92192.1 glycerophosphoryl diester phosphodiesterase [Photobacterium jeanii]